MCVAKLKERKRLSHRINIESKENHRRSVAGGNYQKISCNEVAMSAAERTRADIWKCVLVIGMYQSLRETERSAISENFFMAKICKETKAKSIIIINFGNNVSLATRGVAKLSSEIKMKGKLKAICNVIGPAVMTAGGAMPEGGGKQTRA